MDMRDSFYWRKWQYYFEHSKANLCDHFSFFSSLAFNLFFIFYVHRVQKVKVGMEKHIRQNVDRVSSKRKKRMLSSTVQSKHNRWHEEVCTSGKKKLTSKNSLPMTRKSLQKKRLLSISQHKLEFTVIWTHYVKTSTFTWTVILYS